MQPGTLSIQDLLKIDQPRGIMLYDYITNTTNLGLVYIP